MLSAEKIKSAIRFATSNEATIRASDRAACYYCKQIYPAEEVVDFLATERTALCPRCGIDSVIPSKSPFDLTPEVLEILHKHWF